MLDLSKWKVNTQPLWMQGALDLSTAQVPTALSVDRDPATGDQSPPIVPTIEAYQGGIGIAQQHPRGAVVLNDAAAQTALITPTRSEMTQQCGLLLGVSLQASALGASRQFRIAMANDAVAITLAFATVASSATVSWATLAGSMDARIYIPPGFEVQVAALNLIAGETYTVEAFTLLMPAGFKPF